MSAFLDLACEVPEHWRPLYRGVDRERWCRGDGGVLFVDFERELIDNGPIDFPLEQTVICAARYKPPNDTLFQPAITLNTTPHTTVVGLMSRIDRDLPIRNATTRIELLLEIA